MLARLALLTEVFHMISISPSRQMLGIPQLSNDCFLLDHFQFIMDLSSYHLLLHSLTTDSTVKQSTRKQAAYHTL
jgi:hypothetical protein